MSSLPCSETNMAASRCPPAAKRSSWSRSSSVATTTNTSWRPCAATTRCAPLSTVAKNGSEKNFSSGSQTTKATVSLRRVTRLRAAALGTYARRLAAASTFSRAASLTRGDPVRTRLAVARDTPAAAATDSSVAGTRSPDPTIAACPPTRIRPAEAEGAQPMPQGGDGGRPDRGPPRSCGRGRLTRPRRRPCGTARAGSGPGRADGRTGARGRPRRRRPRRCPGSRPRPRPPAGTRGR